MDVLDNDYFNLKMKTGDEAFNKIVELAKNNDAGQFFELARLIIEMDAAKKQLKNAKLDAYLSWLNSDHRLLYEESFIKELRVHFWNEFTNVRNFYEDINTPEKTEHLCSVIKKCGIFDDPNKNCRCMLKIMEPQGFHSYREHVFKVFKPDKDFRYL